MLSKKHWETIEGSLNREQKCVCVSFYGKQSSSLFPTSEQESSPRMQMDRGEVEVEEVRQTRVRRASILTTNKKRNECEVMYISCAKGRAKHYMQSIMWNYVLTLGLWMKCCSRETSGLPPR